MIRCLSGVEFKSSSKEKEGFVQENNFVQGTLAQNNNFKIKDQSSHILTNVSAPRIFRFEDVFEKKSSSKPPSQRIQFRLPSGMALRLSGENPTIRGLSKNNENLKQEQDKDLFAVSKDKSIERKTLLLEEFAGKKFVCIDTSGSKIVSKEEIVDLWGEKECFLQRFKHEEETVSANFKIFVDQLVSMKTERSGLLNVSEFIELIKKFFAGVTTTENQTEHLTRPPACPYRPVRPKILSAKHEQFSQNCSNFIINSNDTKESIDSKQFDYTPPKVVRLIRATSAVSKVTPKEEEDIVARNIEGQFNRFIGKANYLNSAGKPPLKIPGQYNHLLDETKRNHPYDAYWKTAKAQHHPIVTKAFKISMLPHTSKSSTGKLKTEPVQQNFLGRNYEKQLTQTLFQECTGVAQQQKDTNNSFVRTHDQGLTERSDNNSFLGECDNQQAELECTFQPQEFLIEMENSVLKSFDRNIGNNIKNSNSKNKNISSDIFKDLSQFSINSAKKCGINEKDKDNNKVQILGQQQNNSNNVKGFQNTAEKAQKQVRRNDGQNQLQLQFLQNENEAPCWKAQTDFVNGNGTTTTHGVGGIFGNKSDWNTTRLFRQKEVKVCKNKVSKKGIMLGITKRQLTEQQQTVEEEQQSVGANQEKSSRITFEDRFTRIK